MRWDSAQELGSTAGLIFFFGVYRLLGRWPFRLISAPVILWFFIFKRAPRKAAAEYLGRALKRPPRLADSVRLFFSFADAALDKLIAWNGGFTLSDVEFHGREEIERLMAAGKGFVLIGSHLGNLEIGRVFSKLRRDPEMHVLMHTRHAENFNRMIKKLDPLSQVNLHQVADLDAGLAAFLSARVERGAVVVMAGDRVPVGAGQRVSPAPFLGAEADFPQGPYILAAALGCPVLLLFCLRRASGGPKGFDVYYEPFADRIALPRAGRERALQALAARFAERLEHYCAQAPYQWFNLYPFWETLRRPAASARD
jgi:predicted LPLAT superfamily acyltransferase